MASSFQLPFFSYRKIPLNSCFPSERYLIHLCDNSGCDREVALRGEDVILQTSPTGLWGNFYPFMHYAVKLQALCIIWVKSFACSVCPFGDPDAPFFKMPDKTFVFNGLQIIILSRLPWDGASVLLFFEIWAGNGRSRALKECNENSPNTLIRSVSGCLKVLKFILG
jgi:hypothetical protein